MFSARPHVEVVRVAGDGREGRTGGTAAVVGQRAHGRVLDQLIHDGGLRAEVVLALSHHGEVVELRRVKLQLVHGSVEQAVLLEDPVHCQVREDQFNPRLSSSPRG